MIGGDIIRANDSLGFLLNTAARRIKRDAEQKLAEYCITVSQLIMLIHLNEEGPLTQSTISDNLHSDRATCGVIVEKLVSKGYATKDTCLTNRRYTTITITLAGKEIIKLTENFLIESNKTAVRNFTEEEINNFKHLLNKFILNTEV